MTDATARSERSARAEASAAASDRRRVAVLFAVVAAVVVLTALVVWQGVRLAAADTERDARAELRAEAGTIVAQVLSYDGYTMRDDRLRARSHVTDGYRRRSGLDEEVPAIVTDQALVWSPSTVAVVDADATSGTVLIDGTATRVALGKRTPVEQTLRVQFVARDGRWLVDQIDVVR